MSIGNRINHSRIPSEIISLYLAYFRAIDNALNLYYANHTSDPSLEEILKSASGLLSKRVTLTSILVILGIYPGAYVLKHNHKVIGTSEYLILLPNDLQLFNGMIVKRSNEFETRLLQWIQEYPEADALPSASIVSLTSLTPSRRTSPSKITKLSTTLKNDSSKFKFKAKDEVQQQTLNNGLTLLERIRLKEKQKNEGPQDTKETKYTRYLDGKLGMVYDIMFQTYSQDNASAKTYGLRKFSEIIRDSLRYPMSIEEISDVVHRLETTLGQERIKILTRGGVTVIKINDLNRSKDLELIKKIEPKK